MSQQRAMAAPSLPIFSDPQSHFSIHVPPGWSVDSSGVKGTKLALFAPQIEMGFRANVNVHVQDLQGCSREDFLTTTRWQLKLLTGQEHLERDEPAASPFGGHLLEWSSTFGAIALRFCQLIAFQRNQSYILTGTAPDTCFSNYRNIFQTVFESFRLVPERGPTPVPCPSQK